MHEIETIRSTYFFHYAFLKPFAIPREKQSLKGDKSILRGPEGVVYMGGALPGPQETFRLLLIFCRCVAVSLSLDHSDCETDLCRVWNKIQRSGHFQRCSLPALQLPQENGEWSSPSPRQQPGRLTSAVKLYCLNN